MVDYKQIYQEEIAIGYQTALKYNEAYDTLFYTTLRGKVARKVARYFKETDTILRILDLGCGPGNLAGGLYNVELSKLIFGVDISRDMLKEARKNVPAFLPIQSLAERLPFKNNSFDAVIGFSVLHHLPDLNKLWKELYRIIKPNGLFIFGEPVQSLMGSNVFMRRFLKAPFYLLRLFLEYKNKKKLEIIPNEQLDSLVTSVHRTISINELTTLINNTRLLFSLQFNKTGIITPYVGTVMFVNSPIDYLMFKFVYIIDRVLGVFLRDYSQEIFIQGKVLK